MDLCLGVGEGTCGSVGPGRLFVRVSAFHPSLLGGHFIRELSTIRREGSVISHSSLMQPLCNLLLLVKVGYDLPTTAATSTDAVGRSCLLRTLGPGGYIFSPHDWV